MKLEVRPLTRSAFKPFGDVIETAGARHYPINEGTAERYHDLARIDVGSQGGRPIISVFVAKPWPLPITIRMMERHPLGTQAFVPLQEQDYLVVVARGEAAPGVGDVTAFLARGSQGVNYHRNIWHHPLLALKAESRFLVIDRGGEGGNLQEAMLEEPVVLGW
jgi:ureidoglycolate lyase